MSRYTVLITGGTGQLGRELLRQPWPENVTLIAPGRTELELSSGANIATWSAGRQIDCIINLAGYTAVDLAEDHAGDAYLSNAQGPAWLADLARFRNIPLLHISTDYVFDGSLDRPYSEADCVAPLSVYGASKLAGELAVRAAAPRHVILRCAWIISSQRTNFLKTMLRLAGERPELAVVADQRGCPSGASDIAEALRRIALAQLTDPDASCGTYHLANAGSTTWHGLAKEIMVASAKRGGPSVPVVPIATPDFLTRARRPINSCLDTTKIAQDYGIKLRPWRDAVDAIVNDLLESNKREAV